MRFVNLSVLAALAALLCLLPRECFAGSGSFEDAFIRVANQVGPAVVTLATDGTGKTAALDKFYGDNIGELPARELKQQGLGSGVVIDRQGHIMTSEHVIAGALKITAILKDGRSFEAKVLGRDDLIGLAVLKIEGANIPYADFGNSDTLRSGQWVAAIGNPLGHITRNAQPTISVGVVSAVHRLLPVVTKTTDRCYKDLIQTDASIDVNNFGGPLCDLSGRVVGINVSKPSSGNASCGAGFAIPINAAKSALNDLIAGKAIERGWLGVSVQDVTQELADYLRIMNSDGALIVHVQDNSPAAASGLKPGDIIKTFNDDKIKDVKDFTDKANMVRAGEKVDLTIIRDEEHRAIQVMIEKKPVESSEEEKETTSTSEIAEWRHIRVSAANKDLIAKYGLDDDEGVVVIGISPDSWAYEAGLRPGDVIKEVNRKPIATIEDYKGLAGIIKGKALVRTDRGFYIIKENGRPVGTR